MSDDTSPTRKRRGSRRGNSIIEFTLVGIPVLFTLLSIVEISRGMWAYHTLSHAVRDTARYAAVHGDNCSTNGNTCAITLSDVAARFTYYGGGLDPDDTTLQLRAGCISTDKFSDSTCGSVRSGTLASFASSSTLWPDLGAPEFESVEVLGTYQFRSAISMLWPGAGVVQTFGVYNFSAVSREMMQF